MNNLGWTALHEAVVLADGADTSGRFGLTPAVHAEQRGLSAMAAFLSCAERSGFEKCRALAAN